MRQTKTNSATAKFFAYEDMVLPAGTPWRSADAPSLSEFERRSTAGFRLRLLPEKHARIISLFL